MFPSVADSKQFKTLVLYSFNGYATYHTIVR